MPTGHTSSSYQASHGSSCTSQHTTSPSPSPPAPHDSLLGSKRPTCNTYLHILVSPNAICASDHAAGGSKPFPDVVGLEGMSVLLMTRVICLERRSVRSARGLVLEDGILGVMAGKRVGMSVVWVPDENVHSVDSSQLTENLKPDQVLRSLETSSFVPEEWGLPPFDDSLASQETARENWISPHI